MRDDEDRAGEVVGQEADEPVDRLEVEVVRGLVEQRHVGPPEEDLGDQDAQLVASGFLRLRIGSVCFSVGDAETHEQARGVGLGGVAVVLGDDALELREAHAHGVVDLAGEELFFLLHGRPQLGLAGHHGVEDALLVVGEMVLLEDAELDVAGDVDAPRVPLLAAGEHVEQGGLAGAVGAGDAIALAGVELDACVLEEDLRAEALGHAV